MLRLILALIIIGAVLFVFSAAFSAGGVKGSIAPGAAPLSPIRGHG